MTMQSFAQALLNPEAALPIGVVGPDGLADAKRFDVYRNNVAASLTRALEAAFPVVRQLVGEAFFGAMAVVFLRANPPRDRRIMLYGAEFPAFLAQFPPVSHLGYLPDIARLEQALRESYHAADSTSVAPESLTSLTDTDLLQARFRLAPTVRVLRSNWPIHAIWQANAKGGPAPVMRAEDIVVLRPDYDPMPYLLPPDGAAFLLALQAGKPLSAALSETAEVFDLSAMLGLLLQGRALIEVAQ